MYRITGACVQVTTGGTRTYVYPPAGLPEDVPQSEIDHLLSVGLVERDDTPASQPTQGGGGEGGLPADAPKGNASAEEWRAYAVSQGMAEEQVAALSREEIKAELVK